MARLWRKRGLLASLYWKGKERRLLCANRGIVERGQWCFTSPSFMLELLVWAFWGKVQVAAPSRQAAACGCSPNQRMHLCLLTRAFSAAQPRVELAPTPSTGPVPAPALLSGDVAATKAGKQPAQETPRWGDPASPAAPEATCGVSSSQAQPKHGRRWLPPTAACLVPSALSLAHFGCAVPSDALPWSRTQRSIPTP